MTEIKGENYQKVVVCDTYYELVRSNLDALGSIVPKREMLEGWIASLENDAKEHQEGVMEGKNLSMKNASLLIQELRLRINQEE